MGVMHMAIICVFVTKKHIKIYFKCLIQHYYSILKKAKGLIIQ
jgi:hypothetical protein